jgi:branched-chain amino acid transport system substrate-binding protein
VSIDKVTAVFGGHCSTETLAIAPLSARDHVPVFAVFSNVPVIPNEGEWLFRHSSTNTYYATKLAEQAYAKGHRSIAMLTEVKDLPVTYSDAFAKAFTDLGGKIAVDERFDPQTKDYRTNVLKLKGSKYDAVLVSTQGPDVMGLVTTQVEAQNLGKTYLYNLAFSPAKFLEVTGGKMPADYLIVQPYADEMSAKVKVFNDAYVAKYGKKYSFSTFFITADYDIVHRFRDAAQICVQGKGYDGECVRAQFKKAESYSGVAGDVTISDEYSPRGVLTNFGLVKVVGTGQVVEPIK